MALSLCMIILNEELSLDRCLSAVKEYVDEIIIVDTGSTDNSIKIARKYTPKVYNFNWNDDFSNARNFSVSKATKDWILVLDADELISERDLKKIKELIVTTKYDAFYLIQRNYTNNTKRSKWVSVTDSPVYPESKSYKGYAKNPIIRLFKNNHNIFYQGKVHEVVDTTVKNVATLDIPIHHYYEEKSLEQRQLKYLKIAEKNLELEPDGRLYATAAGIYFEFKKDYDKALKYFLKAVELNYKKNQSLECAAECYIMMKNYENAYQIYKKLVKAGYFTSTLCNNMANLLIMYKHNKQALHFFRLALKLGSPNKELIEENIKKLKG